VRDRLTELLRQEGRLDDSKIAECLKIEAETGQSLDRVLLSKNLLPEADLLRILGRALDLEVLDTLEGRSVPADFVSRIPVQFARNYGLVALDVTDGTARVATATPLEVHPMDDLASMLEAEVEPVLAPRSEITNLINRAYRHKADGVDEALSDVAQEDLDHLAAEIEESEDVLDVANKAPIIKLVNSLLFQALKLRASDIHLHPYPDRLQTRFRIDGILYDMESVPKKAQEAVLSRVKVMGKMDIAERRLPQDGRATIKIGDGEVDVRISSIPSSEGERIVLRLLDKTAKLYTLEEIGLDARHRQILEHYGDYAHGIILVTGPTGSGKTTTLYAVLQRIDSKELNVLTIEDPIEYNLPGVSQVQVNVKKGLTFAAGLRAFLRQDPDVMMVGEIRDLETAEIAIRAALTGHLVFSTVHTNDAPGTVTRLVDIGVEPYLVSSSLLLVVAQRLVRVLCRNCRDRVKPDEVLVEKLKACGLDPDQLPEGKVTIGRGCADCFHSGFSGRTAIYEMLPTDDALRAQIMQRTGATDIKRSAMERGMITLRMDGAKKVLAGLTSPDEVLRVTQLDVF
jgi:general secretion pathway protein E